MAHPGHVTRVAEEVGLQREALRSGLVRELLPTLLKKERKGGLQRLQARVIPHSFSLNETCRYGLI